MGHDHTLTDVDDLIRTAIGYLDNAAEPSAFGEQLIDQLEDLRTSLAQHQDRLLMWESGEDFDNGCQ